MQTLLSVEIFLLGLLLGSFLGLAAVRLPKGESLLFPRSHCRACDRPLSWYENIPLISYLALKGRCRSCGVVLSWHYPVLELSTALLSLYAYHHLPPWPRFALYLGLFLLPVLLLMAIDAKYQLLPDVLTLPGVAAGFFLHWAEGRFWPGHLPAAPTLHLLAESLFGALAGFLTLLLIALVYRALRHREGMGGGDIKFAAMLGAFFGWKAIFFIFLMASVGGALLGGLWILLRRASKETTLPFGIFLGAAAILYLFHGPALIRSYLQMMHKLL